MSTLQDQLDRLIQRKGEQDPLVQMLRNQIQAEKSGKTFQELYLTGSIKKQPSQSEQDHVLDLLRQFNLPLTRDNYLGLAYPEGLPEDWGAEGEAGLPEEIRKSQVKVK
jgi:hypothetical protein